GQQSFSSPPPPQKQPGYLEEALTKLALNTNSFMDETRANFKNQEASIRNLEVQVGGKSIEIQDHEAAEDSCSPHPKEKKKNEPIAYMPKPPYPQRLKAENKSKAPKKELKEENSTNDSMKFQLVQQVPYLHTIMGSNNNSCMITKDVYNKFFEPP
ncbi:hypothetical protein PIB30_103597, partial [Stylosanthes scabra]|nr:hypothetical protein [Stylosanthes scabra]